MREEKTPRGGASEHDRSYKRLFSHPAAVAELLHGFLGEDWAAGLDVTTLERVPGSFVSGNLRERHDDLVWRLRFRDGGRDWFYLYLLLEFQSTSYHFMAVRLLTYVSLLLEGIIREEKLKAGDPLPAVLPLVIYNGRRPWRAPQDLASLYRPMPSGLRSRLPDLRYVLLDPGRMELARPELAGNRVATLFRIEACRDALEIPDLVEHLAGLIPSGEETELRRTFTVWIRSVLRRTFPGDIISSAVDLEEESMLEENMKIWLQNVRREEKRLALREVLLSQMTLRFGRLPRPVRRRVEETTSVRELKELARRVVTAETLQDMQLG